MPSALDNPVDIPMKLVKKMEIRLVRPKRAVVDSAAVESRRERQRRLLQRQAQSKAQMLLCSSLVFQLSSSFTLLSVLNAMVVLSGLLG